MMPGGMNFGARVSGAVRTLHLYLRRALLQEVAADILDCDHAHIEDKAKRTATSAHDACEVHLMRANTLPIMTDPESVFRICLPLRNRRRRSFADKNV